MAEGSEDRRGVKIKFRKAILAIPRHTSEKTGLIDEPKDTVYIAVLKEERKEKKKEKKKKFGMNLFLCSQMTAFYALLLS